MILCELLSKNKCSCLVIVQLYFMDMNIFFAANIYYFI